MIHWPSSKPAESYREAAGRIRAWLERDEVEAVRPDSRLCWMTHGEPTQDCLILLHGYTNSPRQFNALGRMFFELGINVLIPRFPHHGLLDRMTLALAQLTGEELLQTMTEAVDIAQGLGQRTLVAGLSMGGVLAGWAAQTRPEVSRAVLIAPALAVQAIPFRWTPLVAQALLLLPNRFRWRDPESREGSRPEHIYPRYSTHALAHLLQLSLRLQRSAQHRPPQVRSIVLITNPYDAVVDNRGAEQLANSWRASAPQAVTQLSLEAFPNLPHDLIDPDQPLQQTAAVYPLLKESILRGL